VSVFEVPQGRLRTPFYSRMRALDSVNRWHTWSGYTVPDELYCAETEYFAIRNSAGVFDLTPMSKYRVTGPDALAYVDRLVTRDMSKIRPGRVAYAVWCDDRGQVIDDGTIFHLREGALAVQGPTTYAILGNMGVPGLAELKPFGLMHVDFEGAELMVSRTGFTGDLGYELWITPDKAEALWDALFEAGRHYNMRAIGTDALEQARIEAGFLMAYSDFIPATAAVRPGRTRSPFELGLSWLVDFKKPVFNGRRALAEELRGGSTWRLVKLDIEGNKPAHHSYIFAKPKANKQEIGFVTSATWSPVCKQNIAIGTVRTPHGEVGSTLWVDIYYQREMHWSRVMAKATVVDKPFWFPPRRGATPPEKF
jgi:aminomethyltransferase